MRCKGSDFLSITLSENITKSQKIRYLSIPIKINLTYDMNDMPGEWWTAPTESESGRLIMVTGRDDVDKFRDNPRFNIRVEVSWKYGGDASGMPGADDAAMMEAVTDRLAETLRKDPVAVMTGIYTGDDRRDWIFYTLSVHIFGRKLNEALADLPLLPLTVYTENDPDWDEYAEMSQARVDVS